jgi:hypothetical protein
LCYLRTRQTWKPSHASLLYKIGDVGCSRERVSRIGCVSNRISHSNFAFASLTHLLWMKPTPRATVIEFFFPKGFAHDYEFTVSDTSVSELLVMSLISTFCCRSQEPSVSCTMVSGATNTLPHRIRPRLPIQKDFKATRFLSVSLSVDGFVIVLLTHPTTMVGFRRRQDRSPIDPRSIIDRGDGRSRRRGSRPDTPRR